MNELYSRYFSTNPPARTTVVTANLYMTLDEGENSQITQGVIIRISLFAKPVTTVVLAGGFVLKYLE